MSSTDLVNKSEHIEKKNLFSSLTVSSLVSWTVVIALYLLIEWVYNQHLLEIMQLSHITHAQFQYTEGFGKIVASLGINLFFKKLIDFKNKWLIITLPVAYMALTLLFNVVIDQFPASFKYSSFYSMLYRAEVLKQKDENHMTEFADNKAWYQKGMLMSYFVFTLNDKKWQKFEHDSRTPVLARTDKLTAQKAQLWSQYKDAMNLKDRLDDAWLKYSQGNMKYQNYAHTIFRKRAYATFMKKSGGIPPELSQAEFLNHVKGGRQYQDFQKKVMIEGIPEAGITPLYGWNVPAGMNQDTFNQYVDTQIAHILTEAAPSLETINNNEKARDAVAILVIPPLSIGLSLMSIILNVSLLVWNWLGLLQSVHSNKMKSGIIYSIVVMLILIGFASMKNSLLSENTYWTQMENLASTDYPKLHYFWQFTLRFEPVLCLTTEVPVQSHKVTHLIYGN